MYPNSVRDHFNSKPFIKDFPSLCIHFLVHDYMYYFRNKHIIILLLFFIILLFIIYYYIIYHYILYYYLFIILLFIIYYYFIIYYIIIYYFIIYFRNKYIILCYFEITQKLLWFNFHE